MIDTMKSHLRTLLRRNRGEWGLYKSWSESSPASTTGTHQCSDRRNGSQYEAPITTLGWRITR